MNNNTTRAAGILLPVFSLPSDYNQGCFSEEAYRFIDFLAESGMTVWQVLPLEPVDECFSPYRPESCFAIDPAFIDPADLLARGWLTDEEFEEEKSLLAAARRDPATGRLCYAAIRPIQEKYRRIAYQRFTKESDTQAFQAFCDANVDWLPDFTMYHFLKEKFGDGRWQNWPEEYKRRDPQALWILQEQNPDALTFLAWEQWLARTEWNRLHDYANTHGIRLLGDLPIYAAGESSDCWAHPELFQLNENLDETSVAGVPPDYFAADGQLWGNPLYRWDDPRTTDWWMDRIRQKSALFDCLRIDHFRGFEAYFAIPNGGLPKDGHWEPGPGIEFFRRLSDAIPGIEERLIAEDLGFLTDGVRALLSETGFPGMKVLQFAFDSDESNPYRPEHCPENSVIYTGTHDNNTSRGWFAELPDWQHQILSGYIGYYIGTAVAKIAEAGGNEGDTPATHAAEAELGCSAEQLQRWQNGDIREEDIAELLMLLAARSDSRLAIFPMQDILHLGSEARINVPGIANGNWNWQMEEGSYPRERSERLQKLLARCGRA